MFRAFRIPCTRNCGPQEIIRLALSSKMYGVSLSLTAEGILSVGEAAQTRTAFHEAGLTLTSLCADRCLTEDDAALVTLAAEIGARALSLRLRERLPDAQSTLALRQLCTCAAEKGLEIWLETAGAFPSGKTLGQLLEAVNCPNLKAVWNLPCTVAQGESAADTLSFLGSRLAQLHVSQTPAMEVPLREALMALRQLRYTGFVCLDWENSQASLLAGCRWIDGCDQKSALVDVPLPPLYPPAGHPRVMFRKEDIPAIRARMAVPENADAMRRYRNALKPEAEIFLPADIRQEMEQMTPEELEQSKNRDRGMGAADVKYQHIRADILDNIEIRAFAYAIEGDEAMGRSALDALSVYLENCMALVYDDLGQLVFVAAEVYDWCYPLLAEDRRQSLIDQILSFAQRLEIGWPPVKQSAIHGHGVESQLFRDLFALGIATYEDRPEIYDAAAGLLIWEFIPPRRFFNAAHMNMQGGQYTIYRAHWEFLSAALLRGMGMPNLFGPSQGHLLDWLIWARRPDGVHLIDGDNSIHNLPPVDFYEQPDAVESYYTDELDWLTYGRLPSAPHQLQDPQPSNILYDTSAKRGYLLASALYRNSAYKEEALRCLPGFRLPEPYRNRSLNTVEFLLMNDPDVKPLPHNQLPKVRYFPFPKGSYLARTAWNDGRESPDVLCEMKINEYWSTNHQHQDAGAFQLYYKGMLATDSGYYQSKIVFFDIEKRKTSTVGDTGYGSHHDYNYNKATIAHNCMLVLDPDEAGMETKPMGGQPMLPKTYFRFHDYMAETHNRIGQVLAHHSQDGFTYLSGEISRAYHEKVRGYVRSFVFVEFENRACPAALFVHDDITAADPDFRKYWLCHGINPPVVTGNRSVFSVTERGYNGRLTVDTLLPRQDDLEISAITDPTDFDVFGKKYPADLYEGRQNAGGACRIMVSPKTARARDRFLHALQVSDADGPEMEAALYAEGRGVCGAVLYDTAILFGEADATTLQLTLPASCRRVLLCGVHGTWQFNGIHYAIPADQGMVLLPALQQLRGEKLQEE